MVELVGDAGYVGIVLVANVVLVAIAGWLWYNARGRAVRLFVGWLVVNALTGVFVLGNVYVAGTGTGQAFYLVGTAISTLATPLAFLFVLAYTGRGHWVSKPQLVVPLGVWIAAALVFLLTDPLHGLAVSEYILVAEPISFVSGVPSPLYSLVFVPMLPLLIAVPGLLGAMALQESGATRAQATLLLVGFLMPFVALSLQASQAIPGPLSGPYVFTALATGLLVVFAVRRYGLFDLVPVSRGMALDQLDEAVILLDQNRRLLDANRAAESRFPALADSVGRDVADLFPALLVDEEGNQDQLETRFVDSFSRYEGGERKTYDVTAAPLPSGETPHGYGLVVRDVTERQQRVRDLEQQTAQLERFASTLSHDIRNPLNVVQGRIELARVDDDVAHLERAETAGDRIERIVDDLLALSREGRTISDREPVGLATVARNAWETTQTTSSTLEVDVPDDATVYADETRLRNVLENLFRNAIQFGGPEVTVRVGINGEGFFVEDDGPGIPAEERESVFEYEYTTGESGTGLGLAIVESITRAHGWSVSVTDGDVGGARFTVSGVEVRSSPEDVVPANADDEPAECRSG